MKNPNIPSGVWPAMITPLNSDHSIDWRGVDALTDWYIESGVAGLFAVGQSSEMFYLSNEERIALAQRVIARVAGRVPVVASGTFGGSMSDQAEFIKRMADTGVEAVTVLASEIVEPNEDDRVCQERLEQLLGLTNDIALALYECPLPYHRLISPELVRWAANTGRFFLLKETSRSIEQVQAKIEAASGTSLRVLNADATSLLESLRMGGQGYCGIAANFYPDLLAWLCAHFADAPETADQLQGMFDTADVVLHFKYPVCAKYFRQQAGFDILTHSRVTQAELNSYDKRVLDGLTALVNFQRQNLGNLKTASH